jgi:hypothetical protein
MKGWRVGSSTTTTVSTGGVTRPRVLLSKAGGDVPCLPNSEGNISASPLGNSPHVIAISDFNEPRMSICLTAQRGADKLRAIGRARLSERSDTKQQSDCPPWPILNRLRQVSRLDTLAARQVRNRSRQLEDAVEGTSAHLQLLHRRPHQSPPRLVQLTDLAHLSRPHIGVAREGRAV